MRKPIIGVTCAQSTKETEIPTWTIKINIVKNDHLLKIAQFGGIPIIIPVTANLANVEAYADMIDGLYLSGGGDIDPHTYNSTKRNQLITGVDLERDAVEIALFRAVRNQNKPILGICRGSQLINVAMGGSLIQDIQSRVKNSLMHMQNTHPQFASHYVKFNPNSKLHEIFGVDKILVNSLHHQAVNPDTLPNQLKAVGQAKDGIIEAIEVTGSNAPIIGIQWHPEHMETEETEKLFKFFIKHCQTKPHY